MFSFCKVPAAGAPHRDSNASPTYFRRAFFGAAQPPFYGHRDAEIFDLFVIALSRWKTAS
jgi:hypothetical protein